MSTTKGLDRRAFIKTGLTGVAAASIAGSGMLATNAKAETLRRPIKIADQAILSGDLGMYGKFHEMGSRFAVEEINSNGGILGNKIEYIMKDSTLKPAVAIRNARYFVEQWGADLLMGIDSSSQALAVGKIMPELNKPLIVDHAATSQLTENLVYKEGIKQIFRISVPTYQDGESAAFVASKLPIKRWATISPSYTYGRVSWKAFMDTLKRLKPDVKFVSESWAHFGTVDFSSHISKVMSSDAEGFYSTEWAGELISLINQGKKFGLFKKFKEILLPVGGAMDVVEALGKGYPEGTWISCRYWFEYPPTNINSSFVKRFHNRWGRFPHYVSETSYSAIHAYKKAVEKAGSVETNAIISALEGLAFVSPAGRRWIRKADHQAVYEVPWGRISHTASKPYITLKKDLVVWPAETYYPHPPFTPIKDYPPYYYPPYYNNK